MREGGAKLLIGLFAAAHCLALAADEPRLAPRNPRFIEWHDRRIAALTNETAAIESAAATNFGYRPGPVDFSHLREAYRLYRSGGTTSARRAPLRLGASVPPPEWDSRDVNGSNWVTSVKNQGSYGACWAFSTMACLETTLLRTGGGAFDLCENHLARHPNSGFLWTFGEGGNAEMAMAMLTRWQDPLREDQDPYPNPGSTAAASACLHVQDVDIVPARADSTDNDELKRAVMRCGAVMAAMRWDDTCVNPQTGAHCYNGTGDQNHAVTVVGWDDGYPLENFPSSRRPATNGAFLIKNSWGADYGLTTNGYNWISYCDTKFARNTYQTSIAIASVEPATNYGLIYEYDPNGMFDATGYGGSGVWGANLFKSCATGVVAAVGFYALSPGTAYTVSVYTNCWTSKPDTGGLASTQSGTTTMAGYLTVPLEHEVPIVELNERFSVVVHLDSPGCEYPLAIETSYPGYAVATANACESFISKDGSSWSDLVRLFADANCCIKAYTKYGSDHVPRGPTNVYVQAGSASPRPDGSAADPYPTIGAALERVIEGDVVLVGPGTYGECVEVPRERVEIRATEGPSVTFIDPAASNCCYYGGANAGTLLAGFTLTNGCCNIGGGACYGTLSNCVIVGCHAYRYLGGYLYDGGYGGGAYGARLTDCVVRSCTSELAGGAISDCWAENVVLSNNAATGYGGGAFCSSLSNCLAVGNLAYDGGGACNCFLANGTVADNYAIDFAGGARLDGRWFAVNTSFGTNVCARGYAYGNDVYGLGFFSLTNCLVDADARYVDPAHGDYRLSANSPCLDAGRNDRIGGLTRDLAGGRRLVGARVDIGCYEYDHVPAGWTDPCVTADDSPAAEAAKVQASLAAAGFPSETASHVTSSAQYAALTAWAEQRGVPTAALVASPTALVSSALWADALLDLEPEDLHLVGLEPSADGWTLCLSLDDYRASRANAALLKAAVGITGADALDKTFDSAGLTLDVTPREDHVELSVRPPAAATTYFLKTTIR